MVYEFSRALYKSASGFCSMITARSVFSLRSFHESFCVSFQVVTRFSASKKRHTHHHSGKVLSEFWVFQEKVDMKVSAFSFTTSLLVFGYL